MIGCDPGGSAAGALKKHMVLLNWLCAGQARAHEMGDWPASRR